MRPPITTGRVYVRQLLDMTGATASMASALDEVRHLYEWNNARAVVGVQITFAPTAAAILAIVAKPDSTAVVIVAAAFVTVMLGLGLGLVWALNWQAG